MNFLHDAVVFLDQLDLFGIITMFCFMIILEVPRYFLGFASAGLFHVFHEPHSAHYAPVALTGRKPRISVVIAGHNEAKSIRDCLRSLSEQTVKIDQIIVVDDGSTDGMSSVLQGLRKERLIDISITNQLRCGKAAGCNLAVVYATGDIIVNVDADSSFDCDAIEKIVLPFRDPKVGAVSGNIGVRNSGVSLVAGFQAIEYLISISLGKRTADMVGMVACASGAFSAFRKEALVQIGGNSSGPGEDFDMTSRLRRSGWKIRFAGDSWCMTDVPHTLAALIRQRRRWDRDTLRLRMRKFRDAHLLGRGNVRGAIVTDHLDFLIFNLLPTLAFPAYLIFLFWWYGAASILILTAVAAVYIVLDMISFWIAVEVSGRRSAALWWPYLLGYGIFNAYIMRSVRIFAYFEEWVFRSSYKDTYVPKRVLNVIPHY